MTFLLGAALFFTIIFFSEALSLLDIHQAQAPMSTYLSSNFGKNEDDAIIVNSVDEEDPSTQKGALLESKSIPIIESPIAMSNPIWKLISRAGDFYQIFRRNAGTKVPLTPATRWKLLRV